VGAPVFPYFHNAIPFSKQPISAYLRPENLRKSPSLHA